MEDGREHSDTYEGEAEQQISEQTTGAQRPGGTKGTVTTQ